MTDDTYHCNPVFMPGKEDPTVLSDALNNLRNASVSLQLVQNGVTKKVMGLTYKDVTTTLEHARSAVNFLEKARNAPGTRLWISWGDIGKNELPKDELVTFVKKGTTNKRRFARIIQSMTRDIEELQARCLHGLEQLEEKKQSAIFSEIMRELP